ncbi:MAG: zinc-ribbon domain-containing protein [Anaerolineales bacterium]|nr:zinc-ribbon domain-containing protein [Anaerolineales bacterium]
MIVYGYRNREIVRGTGDFYCPKCEVQRQYKHKKIVRYFTLFFIPLFPLGTLNEYVECGVCGRTYKPEILSIPSTIGSNSASQAMADSTNQTFLQSQVDSQPASEPKRNSCLSWVLIVGGLVSFFAACLMGIALFATQADSSTTSGMASFILALIICPGPLALLGAAGIGGGVFLLRNKEEIYNQ